MRVADPTDAGHLRDDHQGLPDLPGHRPDAEHRRLPVADHPGHRPDADHRSHRGADHRNHQDADHRDVDRHHRIHPDEGQWDADHPAGAERADQKDSWAAEAAEPDDRTD